MSDPNLRTRPRSTVGLLASALALTWPCHALADSDDGDPLANESGDPLLSSVNEEQLPPADPGYDGPFAQGRIGVNILLGSASFGPSNYLLLGAGATYYVLDGLGVGLAADAWLLDDPGIYTVTPQARYVLYFVPVVQPYVGVFYRHYFIDSDFEDVDSLGGRLGAYLWADGPGTYVGVGALYERFLDCDDDLGDCDSWYPEVTIGFSF